MSAGKGTVMGTRKDASYGLQMARTYHHTVTGWRTVHGGSETLLCEAQPCALSRSAHTSAPVPDEGRSILPEADYRYALYTLPAVRFRLGDRVEVTDGVSVYHGRTSDSFCYPGHCVTIMKVLEVLPVSGQNSHETEGYGL